MIIFKHLSSLSRKRYLHKYIRQEMKFFQFGSGKISDTMQRPTTLCYQSQVTFTWYDLELVPEIIVYVSTLDVTSPQRNRRLENLLE